MSEERDGAPEGVSEDTTAADVAEANTGQQPGDDAAAAAEGEGEGEQPKPKTRTAQERIDELTRDKHAERRRAETAERELERVRGPKPQEAQQPKEDAEPDPAEYTYGETDPGYIRALARYEGRQAYREEAAKDRQQTQVRTVEETWADRQKAFSKDKPDYFEVLERNWDCSQPMADAIKTSELGAQVAYHLASNPEEARRIAGLNPLAAIREIGRLEARFDTKSGTKPVTASDAPAPPGQVRGNGGRFAADPATTDFAVFEKLADAKG